MEAFKRQTRESFKNKSLLKSASRKKRVPNLDIFGEENPEDEIPTDESGLEREEETVEVNDDEVAPTLAPEKTSLFESDLEVPFAEARGMRVVLLLAKQESGEMTVFLNGERSYVDIEMNHTGAYYSNVKRILQRFCSGFFDGERPPEPEDFFARFKSTWFFGEKNTSKTNRRYNTDYAIEFWNGERVALNLLTPNGLMPEKTEAATLFRIALGADPAILKNRFRDLCCDYASQGNLDGTLEVLSYFKGLTYALGDMGIDLSDRKEDFLFSALKGQPFFISLVQANGRNDRACGPK